jgi:2'-5' RNA ligase
MISYAVALTFPPEVKEELSKLQKEYTEYISYRIEPHITLKYPFATDVGVVVINDRLHKVANATRSFIVVLNGVKYFEGENNVAYVAIENKGPIIDLHYRIVHSLEDLDKEESMEIFDLEVFPRVKDSLSSLHIRYDIEVNSFSLFSAREDDFWKSIGSFELSG